MKWPKFRKEKILDLTERYKRQQEKISNIESDNPEASQSSSQGAFSFLGNLASSSASETQPSEYENVSGDTTEKRKKLAKRLMDMTSKIEDLSNQIYHLQQRIEVLERKSDINRY